MGQHFSFSKKTTDSRQQQQQWRWQHYDGSIEITLARQIIEHVQKNKNLTVTALVECKRTPEMDSILQFAIEGSKTALWWSAYHGNYQNATLLLQKGARIQEADETIALEKQHSEIVTLFSQHRRQQQQQCATTTIKKQENYFTIPQQQIQEEDHASQLCHLCFAPLLKIGLEKPSNNCDRHWLCSGCCLALKVSDLSCCQMLS